MDLAIAIGMFLGTGVAAEIAKRIVPGTKHDSTAVQWLGVVSKVMTLGMSRVIPGEGRLKKK